MISRFIFKTIGWKENGPFPDLKKVVVIIAPHTSMSDFIIGKLYYSTIKRKPKFIIKKEMFFFPFGYILKALGGIPVDRNKGISIIDQIVEQFEKNDNFIINITPEGTRKAIKRWKKGFYQIAEKANVPIAVGFLDYGKKEIGIKMLLTPSGDYETDIKEIKKQYIGITGKHKENFYLDYE